MIAISVSGLQLLGNEPATFGLPVLNFNHWVTATFQSVLQYTQIKLACKKEQGLSFQQQTKPESDEMHLN